jgi:hypothetical protein
VRQDDAQLGRKKSHVCINDEKDSCRSRNIDKAKATVSNPSEIAPITVVGMIGGSVDEVLTNEAIGVNVRSEQSGRADQFQHRNL